jgi:hypothetical protein
LINIFLKMLINIFLKMLINICFEKIQHFSHLPPPPPGVDKGGGAATCRPTSHDGAWPGRSHRCWPWRMRDEALRRQALVAQPPAGRRQTGLGGGGGWWLGFAVVVRLPELLIGLLVDYIFNSYYSLHPVNNVILAFAKKSHKEYNSRNRSKYLPN